LKEYWSKLSFTQKLNHIFWGVIGLLILIFALLNWQVIELHLVFGSIDVPVTILVLLSMLGGYGYAKIFGFIKSRKKDKEISYLKGEVAALRQKVKRPDTVKAPVVIPEPKKEEGEE